MLKKNAFGYKHTKDTNVPLKNFVKCADCDTPFTGYIVKKKNLYYYKCNRIGCRCNRSAKSMHGLFAELLKSYEINSLFLSPLKEQFLHICEALNDSGKDDRLSMEQNLRTLNTKLGKLEERFAFGEIDREIFEKVGGKLKQEIKSINDELKRSGIELSNPAQLIDLLWKSFQISLISGFPGITMISENCRKCYFPVGCCLINNSTIIEPGKSIAFLS